MAGIEVGWETILSNFIFCFTSPSFDIFVRTATAWALCPGRRTITRIYQLADSHSKKAHDAYHRFFREAAWSMTNLWNKLARVLVATLCRAGTLIIDLDDTLFHKTGRRVRDANWWRDAVRSTGQKVVHAFGLNLVVLTLRIKPPWGGEPLGLPVNMRVHRKEGPNLLELAKEMVEEFAAWLPDREFILCADGFYATLAGANLPRTRLVSRMRRDAALYELPPKRFKGQKGRPRKKGKRLPTPQQMAKAQVGWRTVTVEERGKERKRLVLVRNVLWYTVLKNRPVRLVISRDPDGKEKDDFFFTTDLTANPEKVICSYAGRWSIEDTFKNVKQFLGGHQPQTWKKHGPERASAFSLWLYSVIWLWYLKNLSHHRPWLPLPWYKKKTTPSFADALAELRRFLWQDRIFPTSDSQPLLPKNVDYIIHVLARAA